MAFYGKGGIGKSTIVTNLSVLFAKSGNRVLLFGCDPKSDSCYTLIRGPVVTVIDEWIQRGESDLKLEHCLMKSPYGVDCLEVGGPQPGTGCGGRGITKAFELVGDPEALKAKYDVVLFDILGDVVCGGFSAPMRAGYAGEVYIVTSGEIRSLFAANNISQAIRKFSSNGVKMGGLIANLRDNPHEVAAVNTLAAKINSIVIHHIPKDPAVLEAEIKRTPLVDGNVDSPASKAFTELYSRIDSIKSEDMHLPKPLPRSEFDSIFHS